MKIDLYDYFKVPKREGAAGYLRVYQREQICEISPKARPAMLVIPGGGYNHISRREVLKCV